MDGYGNYNYGAIKLTENETGKLQEYGFDMIDNMGAS